MSQCCVYILTNAVNSVLYTGVTSDLPKRIWQHKNNYFQDSFTVKYQIHKLVYYECGDSIGGAIAREKQIKGGSRKKKEDLIKGMNPEWQDLYNELLG
ncbi:MAG: GIY-YIG nuclease family protein [Candidatus Vogelbacteria bacterium]|nr:GIY-YIG nuclease family protein [Candidatus Vogelbacteria bacterium]